MSMLRRQSGGIVLVLAYVLVLQSLAVGLALGAMAAAHAEPLAIICSSKGPIALSPDGEPGAPAKSETHWSCATLCQLASAASAALAPQSGTALAPPHQASAATVTPAEAPRATFMGSMAEARAPPLSI